MSTSILIVTRNRGTQLRLSLPTIIGRYDSEIVVVDDGSTDDTFAVLETHGLNALTVQRDGGYRKNPSAVLNIGHRECSGDIVIEQGGEICHLTDCVTPLTAICRPGVVALARVYHGTPEELQELRSIIETSFFPFPPDYTPERVLTNADHLPVNRFQGTRLYCGLERPVPFLFCGAIHRDDFDAVGGYDETIPCNNDGDLARRLVARGVRFTFSGQAIAFHLEHPKT